MARRYWIVYVIVALAHGNACLAQPSPVTVDHMDGGSTAFELGNYSFNERSLLRRTWYTVNDTASPVQLVGGGVVVRTSPGGTYLTYHPKFDSVITGQAISAFELRYALFDVLGDHLGTIKDLHIVNIGAAGTFQLPGIWPDPPALPAARNKQAVAIVEQRPPGVIEATPVEAHRLLSTVAFVARVRMQDGRMWNFNPGLIAKELTRVFSTPVADAALAPTKERK